MHTFKIVLACIGAAASYAFVAGIVAHERMKVIDQRRRTGKSHGVFLEEADDAFRWIVPAFWPVMLPLVVACVSAYTVIKSFLKLPFSAGYGLSEIGRRFSDWRKKRKIVKAVRESLRGRVTTGSVCNCAASPIPHPVSLQDVAKAKFQGHVHDWLDVGSLKVCRLCEKREDASPSVEYIKGQP